MQAAAVEILGGLAIQIHRVLAALADADELQEAGAIRIAVLAQPRHLVPEPVHRGMASLVAVVAQVAVDVVHLGAPLPGLDRAAARYPDRRMRPLDGARPDVHVALLVEAAVEREGVAFRPCLHHQIVRLVVAVAQHGRVLAIGVARVHRRTDREARDQPTAGDAVDHREFLGDARRRIVQRQRVAHHADRRIGRASRQRRRDQIGRRHQPVAVGMMLVHADRIEAALRRVFQLIHEVVVHQVGALRIEQRGVDVHPDRRILVAEIVRQFRVRHQVEPHQLHAPAPRFRQPLLVSILCAQPVSQPPVSGTNATGRMLRRVTLPAVSLVSSVRS